MKIALAQINPIIGDFKGIEEKILNIIAAEKKKNTDLVIFPELTITGYPPMDLLLKKDFIEQAELVFKKIQNNSNKIAVIIGLPVENKSSGNPLFNAVAFIHNKKIVKIGYKQYLPNYDVFDEARYFEPGTSLSYADFMGLRFGLTVCEDLWNEAGQANRKLYNGSLVKNFFKKNIDIMVNIAASPYHRGKLNFRHKLLSSIARENNWLLIYLNQTGGQDSLIFDGGSSVYSNRGKIVTQAAFFREEVIRFEIKTSLKNNSLKQKQSSSAKEIKAVPLEKKLPANFLRQQRSAEFVNQLTIDALCLGIRDYIGKIGGGKVVLGLSGGIDSALCAYLAAKALQPENVLCFLMPSKFSSKESLEDAIELCKRNGIKYKIYPIHKLYDSYLDTLKDILSSTEIETAHENIQARIRGNILMSYANKYNALLLAASNKSESAVGYATLYGDMAGGLAPIADVPKTLVYELCRFINRQNKELKPIPKEIIRKAPTAELRPGQKDSDSLPDYAILDFVLEGYNDNFESKKNIIPALCKKFNLAPRQGEKITNDIIQKIIGAEFKRKQASLSLKVTQKDFTNGRRFPIVHKYREEI